MFTLKVRNYPSLHLLLHTLVPRCFLILQGGKWTIKHGHGGIAEGFVKRTAHENGWNIFEGSTNHENHSDDKGLAYALGYLEGALTQVFVSSRFSPSPQFLIVALHVFMSEIHLSSLGRLLQPITSLPQPHPPSNRLVRG